MKNTQKLCAFLAGLSPAEVGPELSEEIKYKTLDWMGCVIGALDNKSSRAVLKAVQEAGEGSQCSAFGIPAKTSLYLAAFSNGILGHTLEYDDVNKVAITHPGVIAITAAFAAAEYAKSSYEEYSLGVIAGYETMIRLGEALNPSHYEYWHTTGTCGTFAAAAAAAKVWKLSAEETERAFGIAATTAAGLTGVFGTDAKLVTVGNAVRNGIWAAMLAKQGYTAPSDIIEKEGGYAQAVSKEKDLHALCPAEGDSLKIYDSYYKIHASCGHTHSALDALQKIQKNHPFSLEEIEKIEIEAYEKAVELTGVFDSSTELKAKFSLPYCTGAMLVWGQVGLAQFEPEARENTVVLGLRDKICVKENPSYTREYPLLRIEQVRINLKNGTSLEQKVELPEGKPPKEYIEEKFLSLAGRTCKKEQAQAIKASILGLTAAGSISSLAEDIRNQLKNKEK